MESLTTFVNRYKPYYITDFFLDETHMNVLNALIEIDDLNILIVGSECSGKTSLTHAIIRNYYNMNKSATFPEHNIMFINNLKEQGIQFFRNEMKSFCQSQSNIPGKKKLIVVDDIDSINEQSQQVFRNYIDKYGNNVQFISACTNIQKVNESLQSRLHILKINRLQKKHLVETMNKIIAIEKLQIDAESKEFMLSICNDSIRVLINYLEKIYILGEPIDIKSANNLCSNISYVQFEKYVVQLKNGNLREAIEILCEIHDYGYSVIDILDYFFNFVKFTPNIEENIKYRILPFLCKYITIFHKVHEDSIELAFFTNNLMELWKGE
jgi:DNA polymerase III delta prime subunit